MIPEVNIISSVLYVQDVTLCLCVCVCVCVYVCVQLGICLVCRQIVSNSCVYNQYFASNKLNCVHMFYGL